MTNRPVTHDETFTQYLRTGERLTATEWLARPELKATPVLDGAEKVLFPCDMAPDERKAMHSQAFDLYLRSGKLVTMGDGLALYEMKYNRNHDPKNGQFTSGPGGTGGQGASASSKARSGDKWNALGKDGQGKSLNTKDAANARRNSSDPSIRNAQAMLDKVVIPKGDGTFQTVKDKLSPSLTPQSAWTNNQLIGNLEGTVIPGELNAGRDFSSQKNLNGEINTAAQNALHDRQQLAVDYFTSDAGGGWSKAQAVGIVANLTQESQLDPGKRQNDGGLGRGLAQWTSGSTRAQWFDSLQVGPADYLGGSAAATDAAAGYSSFYSQLSFINTELIQKNPSGMSSYVGVGNDLGQTTDVTSATLIFLKKYESAGASGQESVRTDIANGIWKRVGGQ